MNNTKREHGIDFIRIIACICIIFLHFRNYACIEGVYFGDVLINEESLGWEVKYFVEIFFAIAGYYTYHYIKKIQEGIKFKTFFGKKLIRILPMLTIGTIVNELLLYGMIRQGMYLWDDDYAPNLWGIIISCTGVQQGWVFKDCIINREAWFLDTLLLCYLFFYFLVWLSNRWNVGLRTLFVVMIVIGCAASSYDSAIPFFTASDGRGYESFFMGLLVAEYIRKHGVLRRDCAFAIGVIVIYIIYHIKWPQLLYFGRNHLIALVISPALLLVAQTAFVRKVFAWNAWGLLGKITFSTYIFHVSVIFAVFNIANALRIKIDYGHEVIVLLFLLLAFLIGGIGYWFVECPIIRYLSKRIFGEETKKQG